MQNIHFHVIFRRKLLEQQNLARMNGGHAPHGTPAGLMPPGGNVMGTPTSGIAQRGLNGMSPAPQQIARPRKILFFFCLHVFFLFYLLSSVVCFTDSVTNCSLIQTLDFVPQCGNNIIFLSLRFFVKSNGKNGIFKS